MNRVYFTCGSFFCWNLCLCALAEGKLWMYERKRETLSFPFLSWPVLCFPDLACTILYYPILSLPVEHKCFQKSAAKAWKLYIFSAHNRLIVGSDPSLGGGKLWQIRHIHSGKGGQYIILWAQKTVAHISASNRTVIYFSASMPLKVFI